MQSFLLNSMPASCMLFILAGCKSLVNQCSYCPTILSEEMLENENCLTMHFLVMVPWAQVINCSSCVGRPGEWLDGGDRERLVYWECVLTKRAY